MFYQHPPCVCLLAWQLDDQREKNKRRLLYVLLCATAVLYTRTKGHIWHMVFSKEIFLIIFVCIIPALSDILMTRNRKKGEIYFMHDMSLESTISKFCRKTIKLLFLFCFKVVLSFKLLIFLLILHRVSAFNSSGR